MDKSEAVTGSVGVADLSFRIEVDGRVYREAKQPETEIAA